MDRSEWVLVPRKLTAEMEDAADMRDDDEPLTDWGKMKPASRQAIWDAQIAAAPPPPAEQASGEIQRWRATGDYAYPAEEAVVSETES